MEIDALEDSAGWTRTSFLSDPALMFSSKGLGWVGLSEFIER
jgi:hypothetical protein